jgi:uncharacterized phiE125 gp8 family phage protein
MAVSLSTVKTALKIDYTDDDTELTRLIGVATSWVEYYTGIKLTQATRTMYLREFARTAFADYPYVSTTSVTYTDGGGGTVTMTSGTDYWVDLSGDIKAIEFLNEPSIKEGTLITVTYVAGYSTEPNEVVQAIISLVGLYYNNPEAAQPVGLTTVPLGGQFMLEHLRIRGTFR